MTLPQQTRNAELLSTVVDMLGNSLLATENLASFLFSNDGLPDDILEDDVGAALANVREAFEKLQVATA